MKSRFFTAVKISALLLVFAIAGTIPAEAGQGNGRGRGRGRNTTIVVHDPTPGIPNNSRGRGRNTNVGTRRGRFIRTARTIHINQRNPFPGTPRRRRVRGSGHGRH